MSLSAVGLLDDVMNYPAMVDFRKKMTDSAISLATACFRSGKISDSNSTEGDIKYQFEYGWRQVMRGAIRNDPTVALGRGIVHAVVWITAQLRPFEDGRIYNDEGKITGVYDWKIQIEYSVNDAFVDVWDVLSKIPGNQEIPGGMPFAISDDWWWETSGFVAFRLP